MKRKVRIKHFDYRGVDGKRFFATRDQVVDLTEESIQKGEKINAFYPVDSVAEAATTKEVVETSLTDWMVNEKPTVKEVIERAGDDPVAALELLEAEEVVRDGNSRAGLVDALNKIISDSQDQ